MLKSYSHLTYEARCQIFALRKSGISPPGMAAHLGVHKSTIYRELSRNTGKRGYRYKQAQQLANTKRYEASKTRTKMTDKYVAIIEDTLVKYQWSPEQISGRLKRMLGYSISHERIYQHIWQDKRRGGTLYKHLRHGGKKYHKRSAKTAGRGCIPGRVDIDERPKIVERKQRVGDWELDTIIGKNHKGAIVSMVDRSSKFSKLVLVPNKTADAVTAAINKALKPLRTSVLTMTADNGKEFAMHKELSKSLCAKVYFAKPYHSWERGLNEHTNGLVRQYFPKGTEFDKLTDNDVQRIETLLNFRPRKVLGFRSPMEVFKQTPKQSVGVALHC